MSATVFKLREHKRYDRGERRKLRVRHGNGSLDMTVRYEKSAHRRTKIRKGDWQ